MSQKKVVFAFVSAGFLIFMVIFGMAAQRQGWFSPGVEYEVDFASGEGLFVGTPVSVAGLKAGQVKSVDLGPDNRIIVRIRVQKKFSAYIKDDSKAVLGRPFIIGEKMISLSPGSPAASVLAQGSRLEGEESLEITDLLSGGRLSPYFKTFGVLMEQLRLVIEGDAGHGKNGQTVSLLHLYRQAYASLKSLESVGGDLHLIRTDFATSDETKKLIRDLGAFSETGLPEFTKLMPQLSKTLNETIFTLQAMQRSFVLSGGVARLKDEKAKQDESTRQPASLSKP